MDFHTRYAAYQAAIEQYLEGLFSTDKPYGRLQEAMRYSLLGGGKRIRPVLTLELARLGGIDWHLALPYACALELVHTYSLIHDDLPCMDDDDLRRGKPTCHKAYGETLAVLAGDALQPEAFRLIAEAPCMSAESRVEAIRVLSHAAGADGMVAGQVIDTLCGVSTQQELTGMYRLKTGVMISAAAELGCVASGMPATMRQQAIAFADKLGLAFQIRDDMLDVEGDEAVLGKPIGSDREEGKVTFVDVLGLEGCRTAVEECTRRADAKLGMHFVACTSKNYFPNGELVETCKGYAKETGATITLTEDIESGTKDADVICTDVWVSMGEPDEVWEERIRELSPYKVTKKVMENAGEQAIFLHCLPAFHDLKTKIGKQIHDKFGLDDMEVTDEVFESPQSKVFDEAENRMHTIKAVMVATLGERE